MRKLVYLLISFLVLVSCNETNKLKTETPPIIPMPAEAEYQKGFFNLKDNNIRLICDNDSLKNEMVTIANLIKDSANITEDGKIKLEINPNLDLNDEGYHLTINNEGILLQAKSGAGLFYGVQTLLQMVDEKGNVTHCDINDYPAFSYRGLHLDVSRHFMNVAYIKELIDLMSKYKFNRFHWHLVDGGGWRFESKTYPLLTQKAQARTESDWDKWWDANDRKFVETGTPDSYGGFYTQDEMRDIVKYAQDRYVTIIPEIEMPGHSNEVFSAYPELSCTGKNDGSSEYCIGNPKTFEFLFGILDEVMDIFPSQYIHIGGDEANKENWKKCPKCQALMKKEHLKDVDELQSYCIRTAEEYLNSKGRRIIGWDEILEGGLAPDATVMSWRGEEGGKTAARMKHHVIMTPGNPLYFDHYQAPPLYEPKAIGGYNPLENVYAYNPRPADLTDEENSYILGAQANLWTEFVPNEAHAEYMTWPRALALSEVLWTPANKKNYQDFLVRANIHTFKMMDNGINAFPLKNMKITMDLDTLNKEIIVKVKPERVTAKIHYTTDGSKPTFKSPSTDSIIVIKDSAKLMIQLFEGKKPLFNPIPYEVGYHKGIGKKVIYNCKYNSGYPAGGNKALIDGYRGTWTYLDHLWQGFTQPMDVTIDLGKIDNIHRVKAKFMQVKGAWVYMPKTVEVLLSEDNENFKSIGIIPTEISTDEREIKFEDFVFNTNEKARYVRMKAELPDNLDAFIFTDEILIY